MSEAHPSVEALRVTDNRTAGHSGLLLSVGPAATCSNTRSSRGGPGARDAGWEHGRNRNEPWLEPSFVDLDFA